MNYSLFGANNSPSALAQRYIEAYCSVDLDAIRAILHPEKFQFSHHNRQAYAASAEEFVTMIGQMAKDVFPNRRFTHIHAIHSIDDVVLLDTSWKATPVVTIQGTFEAGVERTLHIKSLMVVENGLITEIRDHDSVDMDLVTG